MAERAPHIDQGQLIILESTPPAFQEQEPKKEELQLIDVVADKITYFDPNNTTSLYFSGNET